SLAAAARAEPAAPPQDEAARMADFFGNTWTIDVNGQWFGKRWLEPDHTYTEQTDDGAAKGTWSLDGDRICTERQPPARGKLKRYCNLGAGHHVGEMWDDQDPQTHNPIRSGLVPGRAK